ncbi:MAG: UvrD-helicase domain-containing protein, partial [Gammaproteobacteria bacterium]|nr:UvrD-helicase domain-containing protein [Gammaproteobacteria bacterium]
MSDKQPPADLPQRRRALDTRQSFIVQAPAGAGKTELLTRRYLALLAGVDNPEEILAITFTKKAAAEMRLRILEALESSSVMDEPQDAFEKEGYELSSAANRRDRECGWNLLENPARLRVQTIDAFCAGLVRQMPVLSKFGAMPQVDDNSDALYRQAVDEMLQDLLSADDGDGLQQSLAIVL